GEPAPNFVELPGSDATGLPAWMRQPRELAELRGVQEDHRDGWLDRDRLDDERLVLVPRGSPADTSRRCRVVGGNIAACVVGVGICLGWEYFPSLRRGVAIQEDVLVHRAGGACAFTLAIPLGERTWIRGDIPPVAQDEG